MTTPISELSANWPAAFAASERQRLEKAIQQLPVNKGSADTGRELNLQELIPAIQQINEVLSSYDVRFEVAQSTPPIVIQVVDGRSGEVIRQIPSEEIVKVAQHLTDLRGVLFRSEA